MVSTRAAVDDINLGFRPTHTLEKRARSSSPVKQRRPTQDWSSLARSDDGSLDRLFSTTALTHDQLINLSKSNRSDRLHISKSDYAIPIPFQIQFPPRLAKSSSPTASLGRSKPPKLVFTGHSYEPISPERASNTSYDELHQMSRPSSPVKPPSVIENRKKVSAFVKSALSDYSDQLSMIEEKSNASSSRSSSYKGKELPSIPVGFNKATHNQSQDLAKNDTAQTQAVTALPTKETIATNSLVAEEIQPSPLSNTQITEIQKFLGRSQPSDSNQTLYQGLAARKTEQLQKPKNSTIASNIKTSPSRLPNSLGFQHNLCVANPPELKIDRRTFSDESQASSVSSFSSVGDFLNFNHAYMSSPNAKGEVRVSKQLADLMLDKDRDTQMKSLSTKEEQGKKFSYPDITKDSPDTTIEPEKSHEIEPENKEHKNGFISRQICSELDESGAKLETSPQNAKSRVHKESKTPRESEVAPLAIQRHDQDELPSLDDNVGAGIGFHFPNNSSNSTNNDEAKKKVVQRQRTRRSSRHSFFSDGKIEIPDLNDDLFWQTKEKTVTNNPIEPIGVPSTGAKEHLKSILGDRSFDSDSDSSFNSQFSKLQSKKEEKSSLPPSKSLGTISSASSPVRHSRHRSMYNIDFDYQNIAKPAPNHHSRSKSNACADTYTNSFSDIGTPKKAHHVRRTSYQDQGYSKRSFKIPENGKISEDFENLEIKVNDPPKKVSYAIDFKSGDAVPDSTPIFHVQGPSQDYYQNFKKSHTPLPNVAIDKYNPEGSDSSSSYRSSNTGRETASTVPTENDNILIDLTEEKYDVCMVSRNDSTTSYKSTIEKTRDGKNVEVVIVEEDEEFDDRDDLSSIYSRYMTSWDDRNSSRMQKNSAIVPSSIGVGRKSSTRSETSEASDASGQSWAASSESNFRVKSLASLKREQAYRPKLGAVNERISSVSSKGKPVMSRNAHNTRQDTSYFDYSVNDSYDFKSFMSQQGQH